ncbi:GntR family transcriptional regulator [Acidimangrovimonas sediminis]|uniref:GntR family transcriptional regulator n=1 Tax=Acidimangrovimonas sediminis TaxID=2056283 RepID=UPI000C80B869|nr:GntR family transcriptional regulator [Acidimangrovimonas sediminis]
MFASRTSLGDEIYEVLLADLISLRIPPGERLSIDALVRQFGVSQTPIRAALIRLEAEGLVTKKHNAGYSVTALPSGKRFADIYAFRLLVEPAMAAGAASNTSERLVAELEKLEQSMLDLTRQNTEASYPKFAQLDAAYHQAIADACGNEVIEEALSRLYTHMHLFRLRYHSTVAEEAVKEHLKITAAIRDGDADAAEAAMRAHIEESRKRMRPFYKVLR